MWRYCQEIVLLKLHNFLAITGQCLHKNAVTFTPNEPTSEQQKNEKATSHSPPRLAGTWLVDHRTRR